MRSIVKVHGLLRGMGREAECDMLAIRETCPGRLPAYLRCSVMEAPPELPDGEYSVSFGAQMVPVKKLGGLWLAVEEPLNGAA